MSIYNNFQKYVSDAGRGGWLCRVILEGCSKYDGKGIATTPCIILNNIITLASALLCSSVLSLS